MAWSQRRPKAVDLCSREPAIAPAQSLVICKTLAIYTYQQLGKFDRGLPAFFENAGHVWKHETYLQRRLGRVSTAGKVPFWRSALGTVGIYIAIRKIRLGIARFFCSYAGHVWKHGNLSTDAGSRISTGGKGCARRSALGTIGIYIAIRKIRPGIARFFARMRGMCGSMETYLQMRGAAFRPAERGALGARRSAP